ncbi:hypothetical protein BDA96_10G189400, partial [Sorghum bicolor]
FRRDPQSIGSGADLLLLQAVAALLRRPAAALLHRVARLPCAPIAIPLLLRRADTGCRRPSPRRPETAPADVLVELLSRKDSPSVGGAGHGCLHLAHQGSTSPATTLSRSLRRREKRTFIGAVRVAWAELGRRSWPTSEPNSWAASGWRSWPILEWRLWVRFQQTSLAAGDEDRTADQRLSPAARDPLCSRRRPRAGVPSSSWWKPAAGRPSSRHARQWWKRKRRRRMSRRVATSTGRAAD